MFFVPPRGRKSIKNRPKIVSENILNEESKRATKNGSKSAQHGSKIAPSWAQIRPKPGWQANGKRRFYFQLLVDPFCYAMLCIRGRIEFDFVRLWNNSGLQNGPIIEPKSIPRAIMLQMQKSLKNIDFFNVFGLPRDQEFIKNQRNW